MRSLRTEFRSTLRAFVFGAYKPGGAMDRTIADDPVRAFADPPLVDDAEKSYFAADAPADAE